MIGIQSLEGHEILNESYYQLLERDLSLLLVILHLADTTVRRNNSPCSQYSSSKCFRFMIPHSCNHHAYAGVL